MNAIGIDLGGTNVKGVRMNAAGVVLNQQTIPIVAGDWKAAVRTTFEALYPKSDPAGSVGLAAPGLPDEHNRKIMFMPGRLPGLEGFEWSEFLGQPVQVLNNAHAALLAEVNFGAAKNCRNVFMLTLGTGVGGGILINGDLYQGRLQRAGSLGDISLNSESDEIGFLQVPGTLEDAIGNESVPKRSGGRYQSTRELVAAYEQGDAFASEVWLKSVKKLAVAIASLINVLAPEKVILGGGIAQANELLFEPLNQYLYHYEWRPDGKSTPIVKAHFNEYAGALGAASYAQQIS